MAIRLKVTPQALHTAADGVNYTTGLLQEDFDNLQRRVRQTASYWVGAAGDQYRRGFEAGKEETDEILRTLRRYPGDLLRMAGVYTETEQANTQAVGALATDFID